MTSKKQVLVQIDSSQDGHNLTQRVSGELFVKGRQIYLRYREPSPEMGNTLTTVKIGGQEIKLIRHGDIRSEQTFIHGGKRNGYYETQHGMLSLETQTRWIRQNLSEGLGSLEWEYDLHVMEEHAGTYTLKLVIQEDKG